MKRLVLQGCWVAVLFGGIAIAPGAGAQSKPSRDNVVAVKVVDLADDQAYLEPGSAAGIAVGDEVRLGGERYRVSATSSSFTVVALGGKALPLGTRGTAAVAKPGTHVDLGPTAPTPLAQFRGEWRPAAPPASRQTPKPVPLGARATGPRNKSRVTLSDALFGVAPLDGEPAFAGNELRGRLHYEPYRELPLMFDADLSLQTFWGEDFALRPGAAARQLLRVREASLTYGTSNGFRGALGRLRAATSMVGQLDGVRLEAPLATGLRFSAFGGGVPQTFNGMISSQVSRFGGELSYEDADAGWRPRVVAGGYASRFDGSFDERRMYAAFDLLPAHGRFGGQAQVSLHDPNNPWHASTLELTQAGLEAELEAGPFHLGGRAQLRRPERSRWLASLLPPEWLCWSSPSRAAAPCSGADASYSWMVDGGVRAGRLTVDLGGQSAFTRGTDASSYGGFANLRWLDIVSTVHLDAGMSVITGSVLRSAAATLSPGLVFAGGRADLSLRYQPALVRYRATLRSSLEHALGASLWLAPSEDLDVDLGGDWIKMDALSAFVFQGVASWNIGL